MSAADVYAAKGLLEWRIPPNGLLYVLYADLVVMVYTAITCYGRFQAAWFRMTSTKVGIILHWQGQLFRGFTSVLLLPMLVRTLIYNVMTSEGIGLLIFAEALWIGVYLGTSGPGWVCLLGLVINPHVWLAVGFFATASSFVPGWLWFGIVFAFLQCGYTRYTYKRSVFGPNPEDFDFESYRDVIYQAPSSRQSLGMGTMMVNHLSIRLRAALFRAGAQPAPLRKLRLEVCSAHNLKKREAACKPCSDLPDPFLKICLGDREHSTKSCQGSLSPEWGIEDDNSFEVRVHPEEEFLGSEKVRLEVWDRGLAMPHRSLGWLELPLSGLLPLLEGTTGCNFRAGLKDGGLAELSFKAQLQDIMPDRMSIFGFRQLSVIDFLKRYSMYIAMLLLVMLFVVASLEKLPLRGRPPGRGQCLEDTGAACYRFMGGCDAYRNSACVFTASFHVTGSCVCNTTVACAYNGICMPRPSLRTYTDNVPVHDLPRKALVLSGGGAKGAWELGVLEGICGSASLAEFRNWTMILGTSIGALNAGFLAQFSPLLQCSQGVPALAEYWQTIVASEDVWESPTTFHLSNNEHTKCLNPLEASALLWYFGPTGGLCDPRPGTERYEFEVSRERIKNSGMELRLLATSLGDGNARWWSENDSSVVQGAEASGSIAPLVWPKDVDGNWFIDGGFIANTPLLQALQEGVQDILVIMLNPLTSPSIRDIAQKRREGQFGLAVLGFEYDIFMYRYFAGIELSTACLNFTKARIRGYVPESSVGGLLDFDSGHISKMRKLGRRAALEEPVDLCARFRRQHSRTMPPQPAPTPTPHPPPPLPTESPMQHVSSRPGWEELSSKWLWADQCVPRGPINMAIYLFLGLALLVATGTCATSWVARRLRGRRRDKALPWAQPSLARPLVLA